MRLLGRTMRGTVSALALGLLTTTGLVAVTTATAPAAMAQAKASEAFVTNYKAATDAVKAKDWNGALAKADAAAPHASNTQQKVAVESVRVSAYTGKGDKAGQIKSLEALIALDSSQAARNRDTLIGLYATQNPAKAEEMIKAGAASSRHYGWLADRNLKAKNFDGAISNGQKAIEQARKEGAKPSATFYNIKLNAFMATKNMDGYYKTLEEVAPMYSQEIYWRPLIDKATKDPKFNRQASGLDLFRAYQAAKINLKTDEKVGMAEQAFARKMSAEAEAVISPLVKDGTIGGAADKNAERNKRMVATITADAKAMKDGSLKAAETAAASAPTGQQFVEVGEQYFGLGDYKKAAELIKTGLDKGQLKPEDEALAKLRLGIAQFKAGQKDAARQTWTAIKADNGAESLARAWIAISKT